MNVKELKEIFKLVEKTDFTEVEIAQGDWRLRVERGKLSQTSSPAMLIQAPTVEVPAGSSFGSASSAPNPTDAATPADSKKEYIVTSPFVGTFYAAPAPDGEPYVRVGQRVTEGQSLCIVEAMKLMNEIESDYDGIIDEIFPESGTPVEFGEKLFRIIPG